MKFWDSSALLPLLVAETTTAAIAAVMSRDSSVLVWWATEIECASALARLEREGALGEAAATTAFERLRQLSAGWQEVDASDAVRETAVRLLRVHPLRAADATQLAAAFVAAERRPASLELVTLDLRLAAAARKEGFPLVEVRA
jgi:predicted nucleic acid-binding protein